MLGLYLDNLIICYILCDIVSKLKQLILHKELQNFIKLLFLDKRSRNTSTTKQKSNIKPLPHASFYCQKFIQYYACNSPGAYTV